jgi:hypothetical protein
MSGNLFFITRILSVLDDHPVMKSFLRDRRDLSAFMLSYCKHRLICMRIRFFQYQAPGLARSLRPCLYERRDGTFAGTGRFIHPGLVAVYMIPLCQDEM